MQLKSAQNAFMEVFKLAKDSGHFGPSHWSQRKGHMEDVGSCSRGDMETKVVYFCHGYNVLESGVLQK